MNVPFVSKQYLSILKRVSVLALSWLLMPTAVVADNLNEPTKFEIDAQALDTALIEFSEQADIQLVVRGALVADLESDGLRGEFTPRTALTTLLDDKGLTYTAIGGDSVAVAAEGEEVSSGLGNVRTTSSQVLIAQNQTGTSRSRTSNPSETKNEIDEDALPLEEIVVIGSNIRGIAPDSSPTIVLDRESIEESGFLTTDQFIRSIPQNFGGGTTNQVGTTDPNDLEAEFNNSTSSAVNLRGLGGNATLTLLNGRRISPSNEAGNIVDISAFPLSAIERVELLTDGASSIYGGDAVAGVVNFVLRDNYDGAELSVSHGVRPEGGMDQSRASLAFGKSWGSGNVLISYEYFDQDELMAGETEFAKEAPLQPSPLIPGQERHGFTLFSNQSLSERVEFDFTALYTDRDTSTLENQRDLFLADNTYNQSQLLIAPSLDIDAGNDWRVVLAGDYSETKLNRTIVSNFLASGDLFAIFTPETNATQYSVDAVADGPIFSLPGGNVRAALGTAYRNEAIESRGTSGDVTSAFDRDVWAVFGELYIPLFGPGNARPGLQRLELNLSARSDDYSDFGSSTNPKIGVLWSPIENLNFRGTYGTSFNPPGAGVLGNAVFDAFIVGFLNPETGVSDAPGLVLGGVAGELLTAEESRAFTAGIDYSFDIGDDDIGVSLTYYDIEFDDRIDRVPFVDGLGSTANILFFRDQYPDELFVDNPTEQQVVALQELALASGGQAGDFFEFSSGLPSPGPGGLDLIFDFRWRNLAATDTRGLDFTTKYNVDTNYGAFNAFLSGNYILEFGKQLTSTSPVIDAHDRVSDPVDLRLRGSLGWSRDGLSVISFVNYTDSYRDVRFTPSIPVEPFTTVDLNITYDFGESRQSSILHDLNISLVTQNLFDQDPPFVEQSLTSISTTNRRYDPTNANPLGRFVTFQIRKQW